MISAAPSDVVRYIQGWIGNAHLNSEPEPGPISVTKFQCRALIALVDSVPSRLITLRSEGRATLVAARAALLGMLDGEAGTFHLSRMAAPYGETPPKIIWRLMRECPDEAPDRRFQTITCITASELRASIEADVGTAHSALANDEFKAATVMAGAAIEALLLWALQDERIFSQLATLKKAPADVGELESAKWGLDAYIKSAAEIGLLDETTQKALELAKDYRNLIHPGRAKRLAAECNRGTAHSAVGGLEQLIILLNRKLSAQ